MSQLFDDISNLSDDQRELFGLMLAKEGADLLALPIPERTPDQPVPLTYSQERIWLVSQLSPDLPVDNVPVAIRLSGSLDVVHFKSAISFVWAKHEILRTYVQITNGHPFQTISSDQDPVIGLDELDGVSVTDRESEATKRMEALAHQAFDLTESPPIRMTLLRLSPKDHIFFLVLHPFIADGFSIRLMLKEIADAYNTISAGESLPVDEPSLQYGDFAVWQKSWINQRQFDAQLTFWKQTLKNATSAMESFPGRSVSATPDMAKSTIPFSLSDSLSTDLRKFLREAGATMFMVLLAGLKVLLYKYTGNSDLVIGTLITNRNRQETQQLLGNFSNNLLFRVDVSDDPPFTILLDRVRDVLVSSYGNQDLPFTVLAEALEEDDSTRGIPAYQFMFILRESSLDRIFSLVNLEARYVPVVMNLTRMEMSMDLVDDGEREINGIFEYKSGLHDSNIIRQFLRDFESVLTTAVENPDYRISRFPGADSIDVAHSANGQKSQKDKMPSAGNRIALSAPRDDIDRQVIEIWKDVLGTDAVGFDSNFFILGGHSFLALSLIGKINKAFETELPVSLVFSCSTVRRFTRTLRLELGFKPPGKLASFLFTLTRLLRKRAHPREKQSISV